MFVNAFELPQTTNGIVHFPGSPRQYRADCKAGIFKIGETDTLADSLQMEILTWRSFNAQLFNYPYQQWIEVFFIDKDNTVSHILFKTESIANFLELMRKLTRYQKSLGTQKVTASTAKRSNDTGTYYAVEFSSIDNKEERVKELAEFVDTNINEIYSARLINTFKPAAEVKELPAQKKAEKAIVGSQKVEDF